jgi:hypothetical protein
MRLFWTLLGCAAAFWTVAELVWGYYALILNEEVPAPSWADVGYLGAIPLTVAALLVHPAMRGSRTRKARSVFEGLVVATALLFLSWTLVLSPLSRSANLSTWGGIVTLGYPFGDVVIVFFIVLAIRGMTGAERLPLWCLLAALLAMAISDSTFTYLTNVANYTSGRLIDTGWVAAYLGIALAAFSSRSRSAVVPTVEQLKAIARVAHIPTGAGSTRAERRRRGDQARPSPRPRGLADGVRADRVGASASGDNRARAARAEPRYASRHVAEARACGCGWRGHRATGLRLSSW